MNKKGIFRTIVWIIILFLVISGIVVFMNLKNKITGAVSVLTGDSEAVDREVDESVDEIDDSIEDDFEEEELEIVDVQESNSR